MDRAASRQLPGAVDGTRARGGHEVTVELLILGSGLVLCLWLSWRFPTLLLVGGLVTLAVRPELLLGGTISQQDWGVPRTLLLLALVMNALRYGVRRQINWPIGALLVVLVLSSALGSLHPKLTPLLMLEGFAVLALPWAFTSVVLAPGSRRGHAAVIALLPLLSALVGALLSLEQPVPDWGFDGSFENVYRLGGALGNAEAFAILAFAGFAVALHEATRPGRGYAGWLAVLNLGLVVLSGTRMAIFAAAVLIVVYASLAPALREMALRQRWLAIIGGAALVATIVLYWPSLQMRLFEGDSGEIFMSERDSLFNFYWEEFLLSPLFGRGVGVGYVAGTDWLTNLQRSTPHNEYMHLLVTGGVVGFLLCAAAIVLWSRQLYLAVPEHERPFLIALAPAFGLCATTADVLLYWTGLALFAYLGVMLTRSATVMPRWAREQALEQAPPAPAPPAPRRAALFRPER
jgi:O-antigen ligase